MYKNKPVSTTLISDTSSRNASKLYQKENRRRQPAIRQITTKISTISNPPQAILNLIVEQ